MLEQCGHRDNEEAARKADIDKEADEWFNGGIFKEIEARKKRMLQKAVQDWELPAN